MGSRASWPGEGGGEGSGSLSIGFEAGGEQGELATLVRARGEG